MTEPTDRALTRLRVDRVAGTGEYEVSLDDVALLEIALDDRVSDVVEARVAVRDRTELTGYCWDDIVAVTESGDVVARTGADRVTVDPLPFGGWAVQADGYDVAIIDPLDDHRARVAVYDRTAGEEFLAFDRPVHHRATERPSLVADRLREFASPASQALVR